MNIKMVFRTKDQLNPVHFNPEQWADVMQDAGIKYMIFTTKHHDGFCTFDSKYTDFSIAHGAFKTIHAKTWLIMYLMHSEKKAS